MTSVAALLWLAPLPATAADTAAAVLTGKVSSAEEGAMEGVLVSAKKAGSTITVTVVTDKDGRYSFPAGRLEPGDYALSIRAAGYELGGPAKAEVAAEHPATADLELRKTRDLAPQLTNADWLASMPGSDDQKAMLLNCVGCHTLERPVSSRHDAAEFVDVLKRMSGYAQMSTPLHPQRRLAELPNPQGEERFKKQAEFLATVNLSQGETWKYPLKTAPRPTGRATRVVITEYDLPRPTSQPHDVVVSDGQVYYTNFGERWFSRLDPKTGKVKEYIVPVLHPKAPIGSLDLEVGDDGQLWFASMFQAIVGRFDKRTETIFIWSLPPDQITDLSQINMVQPQHSKIDHKVWTNDNGIAGLHRMDLDSPKWETFEPFKDKGGVGAHNLYDVITDSQNNAYFTDLNSSMMGRVDAKTGAITYYEVPTKNAGTRRGMMDAQDRLWFAEYKGNKVGMLDTKTGEIKEWAAPSPWTNPYDVAVDKDGELWTASMLNDRVLRLDPATGKSVEYLLPHETNVRRVFVDNSTTPPTFWVGNNHGAAVVKVEPLD
jgi:streptogramin lyase